VTLLQLGFALHLFENGFDSGSLHNIPWTNRQLPTLSIAFGLLPLIFNLPDMKSFWALALPDASFPKSSSESESVTSSNMSQYLWSMRLVV
jgi:hypothetical protein